MLLCHEITVFYFATALWNGPCKWMLNFKAWSISKLLVRRGGWCCDQNKYFCGWHITNIYFSRVSYTTFHFFRDRTFIATTCGIWRMAILILLCWLQNGNDLLFRIVKRPLSCKSKVYPLSLLASKIYLN